MIRRSIFAFALAVLVALTGAARAGGPARDPDLPPIDPPGHWRLMTQDPATTTSQCVGDPRTPLCAVETLQACFVRRDDELCRISLDMSEPPGLVRSTKTPGFFEKYRVLTANRLGAKNLRRIDTDPQYLGDPGHAARAWKVGDVRITTRPTPCWSNPTQCELGVPPRETYILRKQGDRWRMITWYSPDDAQVVGPDRGATRR